MSPPKAKMNKPAEPMICGIVMPISTIDSCTEDHWRDVKLILSEAIEDAGFSPQLVSDADDVGIIQKRIIQNLYENPVVVCDVSAKNPNVMFELGMRLAFDRPTIIIKDDKTSYSFDTSPVEHLTYPRDLRFSKIVEFKEALAEKIKGTFEKSQTDPSYTTFLKNFGTFKVAQLKTEIVPQDQVVLEEVKGLRELILSLHSSARVSDRESPLSNIEMMCLREASQEVADAFFKEVTERGFVARRSATGSNRHAHFRFLMPSKIQRSEVLKIARKHSPEARWLGAIGGAYRPTE
jgi:hypothetical protein